MKKYYMIQRTKYMTKGNKEKYKKRHESSLLRCWVNLMNYIQSTFNLLKNTFIVAYTE